MDKKNKIKNCRNCEYYNTDYEWDEADQEEYEVEYCSKGHDISYDYNPCCDFKEYKPRPYKEKFSECDNCKYLLNCKNVINVTTFDDKERHFDKGFGFCQMREGEL